MSGSGSFWPAITRDIDETGINNLLAQIPYVKLQGFHARLDKGALTLVMPFKQSLVGNVMLPALHGGVIGAFLETTAMIELMIQSEAEHLPRPVDVGIDYLRSGRPKDTSGRATIVKHGRRVANVRVEAWQDDPAKPIAALHGHFLVEPPAKD